MHESEDLNPNGAIVRLFVVLVLYKMKPAESVSFNSLQASMAALQPGQAQISILLYDNTPGGQDPGPIPPNVQYKSDVTNGGLAPAYNYALQNAHEKHFDWLLTLDQDTTLPLDFASKLCQVARFVAPLNNVAAIVPCVSGQGRVISPRIPSRHWAQTKFLPNGFIGISLDKATMAINSASTFKVTTLRSIGGYDPRFWLDFSDVAIFHILQSRNLKVFAAGNIHVEHEVSVSDLMNRTTPTRYQNIYRAEEAFYDEHLGKIEAVVLLAKLVYRLTVKLSRQKATLPYYKVCLRFLGRRMFRSRKRRMEDWNNSPRLQSVT